MRLWTVQSVDVLKSIIKNKIHYNTYIEGVSKTKEKDKRYVEISTYAPIYTFATIHNGFTDYLGVHTMANGFYQIAEKLNLKIFHGYVMIELEVPENSDDIFAIQPVFSEDGYMGVYCHGAGRLDMALTFFKDLSSESSLEVLLLCIKKEWLVGYYEFEKFGDNNMLVFPRKLDCYYGNTMTVNNNLRVCGLGYLVNDEGYAMSEDDEKRFQDRYGLDILLSRMTLREVKEVCSSNINNNEIIDLLDTSMDNDLVTVGDILNVNRNSVHGPIVRLRNLTVDWE